jgi:two-component system nitrate/nitrite response regulator NarL
MEVQRNTGIRDTNFPPDLASSLSPRLKDERPATFIVSDVRLFRDGLSIALSLRPDIAVKGTAGSVDSILLLLDGSRESVVLLDTGMSHVLDVARGIMDATPGTKIIAIAVAEDAADVVACAEAGMAGYVSRDGSVDDVASAIHSVVRGEFSCPPRMVSTIFERLATLAPHRAETTNDEAVLTRRESEVVSLIDEGMSNKEIGRKLRIGTTTVKNHVHHILEKLHVSRRAQAAAALRATRAHSRGAGAIRHSAALRVNHAD